MMQLNDPRQQAKCTHDLGEVVFMTTCAILRGADDWESIQLFADTRKGWFKQYLQLPGGIPSHDTFNRFFLCWIRPVIEKCFVDEFRIC